MHRRRAISLLGLLAGGTALEFSGVLAGCNEPERATGILTKEDIQLLDQVGEALLPATPGVPGAAAARVGDYIQAIVTDCFHKQDQVFFLKGMTQLREAILQKTGGTFDKLQNDERKAVVLFLDEQAGTYKPAKPGDAPQHYYAVMKGLIITGYFTSEAGTTKALRYEAVPGKFRGDIPFKPGDKAFA
ncbi:gluconate 2-dehydrogenase subunit 3 family protein [Niabella drilacis]|uniref:Gluconate 2-dehydrogenase subunit 3 n=1 Tax=Niabella drilacis (strain DSM 25811 / CCM 8410 / CCUG 62505 / LMG 26954 / E90) TaxID=1285928 RepID=A0A1G6M3D2_NIADE|nr:gluconate 2-dehydrogenase subunit 3 family protein [Niabella drilacis]SDC49980.1 Gluconate 2-dehydrogenase subunit 3 [Niabella drilacis]